MVTSGYFYSFSLLLVLQLSVSLSAEVPIQNNATLPKNAQSAIEELTNASIVTPLPNTSNVAPESQDVTSNCSQILTINATIADSKSNTTESQNNTSNCETIPSEASAFPQKETNGTITQDASLSTNATVNDLNLNETEKSFATDQIFDEFPQTQTEVNGAKLLPDNTSLIAGHLNESEDSNKTEVSDADKIDTEVSDLLNTTHEELPRDENEIFAAAPIVPLNETQSINKETELIDDGQNTEDILRNTSLNEERLHGPGVPLVQGQLAAILAAVFVVISIITYVGLLSWRRFLENRYGSRQLLVNEDEFIDKDDMKHFTI